MKQFETKAERNKYLYENQKELIAEKREVMKFGDGISSSMGTFDVTKATATDEDVVNVTAIINTTNWLDSHKDLHVSGIWTKSVQENKRIIHLQEHRQQFDKVIARGEDLDVYVREFDWKELGLDAEGKTEALVFSSRVRKERNKEMFDAYRKGEIDNHSVGMRYVKILLAIDDEDYPESKEVYDKYYPLITNKEDEQDGYFWVVKEAKIIEGSAVLLGSNSMTPTLTVGKKEAVSDTSKSEPLKDTQSLSNILNFY